MSLMDMLQNTIAKQVAGNAAAKLGLPTEMVEKLMPMAQSMMMSKIATNAQKPEGAEALMGALKKHTGSLFDEPTAVDQDGVLNDGQKMMGHVFGGDAGVNQAQNALAKMGGIDASKAAGLLAMAGPLVMGALGKKNQEQGGFDMSSLTGLLNQEKQQAKAAVPSGLGGILDMIDGDDNSDIKDDLLQKGMGMLGGLFGKK